jgi:uncharacterized protein (TIGR02246 family)
MDIAAATRTAMIALHGELLDAWNVRDAARFAALFADNGGSIGFDGSEMSGRREIADQLSAVFGSHPTASYVRKVRDVLPLGDGAAVLRAVVGMVPPGGRDINPAVNAIQTLTARNSGERWEIVLFQNTPAAYHGRPEAVDALTEELRSRLSDA